LLNLSLHLHGILGLDWKCPISGGSTAINLAYLAVAWAQVTGVAMFKFSCQFIQSPGTHSQQQCLFHTGCFQWKASGNTGTNMDAPKSPSDLAKVRRFMDQ